MGTAAPPPGATTARATNADISMRVTLGVGQYWVGEHPVVTFCVAR